MRDFTDNPATGDKAREIWTTPEEVSDLIRDSADRVGGALFGCVVFTPLAWLTADAVAWLSTMAGVLAVVLGLRVIWHLVFLVRAALRFADELDDQAAARSTRRPADSRTDSQTEEH